MSYRLLPDEIVLGIAKLVRLADIENFALVDKRTCRIAHSRLEERRAFKRNAKVMAARFGGPENPHAISNLGWSNFENLRPDLTVKDEAGVPPRDQDAAMKPKKKVAYEVNGREIVADLDYLDLNGDLHWLHMDETTAEEHMSSWPRGRAASKEKLNELIASAERVGVEFPAAFLKIMNSTELINRMFLGGSYFTLGPNLVKCNPEDDKDGGGYVIRFLSDQQSCWTWSLYIAPGGHHCVLNTPNGYPSVDVHCFGCGDKDFYGHQRSGPMEGHPRYEPFESIPRACDKLDLEFVCADFEECLASTHFDGWCGWTVFQGREMTDSQKEYIANLK